LKQLALAVVMTVVVAAAGSAFAAVPSFDAVRAAHAPSDRTLLDRHGLPLHTLRVDASVRRGPWVALDDVSPALRHALLLSEDRRFWQHGGVDWRALAAGAWAAAWNQRTRGASTVTMQLAALLDDELKRPPGGRDLGDKLAQVQRARDLEARWTKAQILEAYLNAVPLRGELVGLSAAADQLFGKHPSGLDALEAALLAAMVRAPNAPAAQVERRACELLREQAPQRPRGQVREQTRAQTPGVLDPCAGLATTLAQALARAPGPLRVAGADRGEALAPHFARQWFATPRAADARSTLDARVQRLALATVRQQLAELRGREVDDGAVVVLDNASGEVLAWVGSAGRGSSAAAVDAVRARRQPGSTIKPFVYALALEQRLVTAASVLDDAPLALATGGGGLYAPRNYDPLYRGAVSARAALASSLNVPAVKVAAMVGPEALFDRLQRAGLGLAESAGFHGHALALGSADVTLLDLTNAYRALARGGRVAPVRWERGGAAGPGAGVGASPAPVDNALFEPAAAWLVADILADPAARAAGFGLDSPLVTRGWAAVKTGTSKDMRDNWCIGFTDRYTVGVWVGNAGGAPMHGVSGVEGAAPVWRAIVSALHEGRPSRAPAPPAGLRLAAGEWWLAGTGPSPAGAATVAGAASAFGITRPRDGSVIALDPEIPPAAQRLVIEGAPGRWVLNGRPIGQGSRLTWLPQPGRHVLERHGGAAEGGRVERVRFEVRPGQPRPAPVAGTTPRRG
jgi:penicillin-binding protein 1C